MAVQFIKLYFGTSKLRNCSLRFIIKGLRAQCERDYILKQIISLITPLVQKHIRCDEGRGTLFRDDTADGSVSPFSKAGLVSSTRSAQSLFLFTLRLHNSRVRWFSLISLLWPEPGLSPFVSPWKTRYWLVIVLRRVILLSKDVDVGSGLLKRGMDNHLFYCDSLRSNFSELVYNECGQFHTSLAKWRIS